MAVKHRCQIRFLALARHTCSLTSSCVHCVLLSPSLPPKLLQLEDIRFVYTSSLIQLLLTELS